MSGHTTLRYGLKNIQDLHKDGIGGLEEFYAAIKEVAHFVLDSEGISAREIKEDRNLGTVEFYVEGDGSVVDMLYSKTESIRSHIDVRNYKLVIDGSKEIDVDVRRTEPAEISGEVPSIVDQTKYIVYKNLRYSWFNLEDFKTAYDYAFAKEINTSTASGYLGRIHKKEELERRGKKGNHEFNLSEGDVVVEAYITGFEEKYPFGVSDIWRNK